MKVGSHVPYEIAVEAVGRSFHCREGQSVLQAMMAVGRQVLPVGCRSGGCGVCRVEVVSGDFDTGTMSAAHISQADRARGIVLACQLYPRSDLRLRAIGSAGIQRDEAVAALIRRFNTNAFGTGTAAI